MRADQVDLTIVNDSLLGTTVRSRAAVAASEAYSGARIERVELTDGTAVVVKRLPATGGLGRTRAIWDRPAGRAVRRGVAPVTRR